MKWAIYYDKKKDFRFERLSPYIKEMIGIENVLQNALRNDRTYDNKCHITIILQLQLLLLK